MKKGSLSLSVNAIVILILAITMLGLGLGFIRGMFGNVSSQLEEQISSEPEPPVATGTNPITLSRESMITQAGSGEVLKVQVYNPYNIDLEIQPNVSCSSEIFAMTQVNPRTVGVGESEDFNILFQLDNVDAKTYLCQVILLNKTDGSDPTAPDYSVEQGLQQDLTITVRQ